MKRLKKLLCLSLALLMLIVFSTSAFATPNKSVTIDEIRQKYDLQRIDPSEVPAGITPMKIDNLEQLDLLLTERTKNTEEQNAKAEATIKKINQRTTNKSKSDENSTQQIKALATGEQTKTLETWLFGTYKMDVKYTYYYDSILKRNLFSSCTYINTYITGVSLGVSYTQNYSSSKKIDGGRTLAANAEGLEKLYLLIDGAVEVYTTKKVFYKEFYL